MTTTIVDPATLSITPRPRTEAQREASRRNGARGRGPGPDARLHTRFNGMRHGLCARVAAALKPEQQADLHHLTAQFTEVLGPRDALEREMVADIAAAAARRRRAEAAEEQHLANRKLRATEDWDLDRLAQVAELMARLEHDPVAALIALRRTSDGCARVGDAWLSLDDALVDRGGWEPAEIALAVRLCGAPADPDRHLHPDAHLIARLGMALPPLDPEAEAALDPEAAEARAADLADLRDLIEARVADLTVAAEGLVKLEAFERAKAPVRAGVDLGREGQLLRRYAGEAHREFHRALADFYRHRRDPGSQTLRRRAAVTSSQAHAAATTPSPSDRPVAPPSTPPVGPAPTSGPPPSRTEPEPSRTEPEPTPGPLAAAASPIVTTVAAGPPPDPSGRPSAAA